MNQYQIDTPIYIKVFDEPIPVDIDKNEYHNPYIKLIEYLNKTSVKELIPDRPYFYDVKVCRYFHEDGELKHIVTEVPIRIYADTYNQLTKAAGGSENIAIGNPAISLKDALAIQSDRKRYEAKVHKEFSEVKTIMDILGNDRVYEIKVLSDILETLKLIADRIKTK